MRLEAVEALGGMRAPGVSDLLLDSFTDPNPAIRAAALRSAAALDPEQFVAVLSDWIPIPIWSVRAALASALGTLPPEIALPRLNAMLGEQDHRVIPAVLDALVKLRAPNVTDVLLERLKAEDPAVRAAAATGLGEIKPAERRAGAGRGVSVRPAGRVVFGPRRRAGRAREVRRGGRDTGADERRWPTRTGPSACARRCC